MSRIIKEDEFLEKVKGGARELINIRYFSLIDGYRNIEDRGIENKEESYFLFDKKNEVILEISLNQAYNLLATYITEKDNEEALNEVIAEIIQTD